MKAFCWGGTLWLCAGPALEEEEEELLLVLEIVLAVAPGTDGFSEEEEVIREVTVLATCGGATSVATRFVGGDCGCGFC